MGQATTLTTALQHRTNNPAGGPQRDNMLPDWGSRQCVSDRQDVDWKLPHLSRNKSTFNVA